MLRASPGGSMRLTPIFRIIAFFALGVALAEASSAQVQTPPSEQQLDAIFSNATQKDVPGVAVLVRKDGRTVFERGYGVRDLRTKAPIDAQTNFRLASFTKQFTAMAIMLLVHDRKLRYDQTLTEIFPDFPAYGKNITIRNLLNHTGGLPDYEDLMMVAETPRNSWIWTPDRQIQDAEVLKLLEAEKKGKFAPGTSWSYSNSGYVVLGQIVAKVSGQSYAGFLYARIFVPLHMNGTIVYLKGINNVTNRAFGHDGLKETDQSPTSAVLGDGGIYSNVEDLAKWDRALREHALLSATEMQAAFTPVSVPGGAKTDDGAPTEYGYGWFLDPYRGRRRTWHSGTTTGFRTFIE